MTEKRLDSGFRRNDEREASSPLLSRLFQDYHIPACHSKYPFLLHCGDDNGAEALRGHGGLDDVGVLPAGFV